MGTRPDWMWQPWPYLWEPVPSWAEELVAIDGSLWIRKR